MLTVRENLGAINALRANGATWPEIAAALAAQGVVRRNGQPITADRLTAFLMLARRFPEARLVHSGDTVPDSQSAVARELLLGAGIDPERIVFETKSRITCGSPRATLDVVAVNPSQRWLLVTSAIHMPRSVACFRAAGWDVTPYPTNFRVGADPFGFGLPENLEGVDVAAHEWVGLLYYRLRGYTHDLFPGP